MAANPEQKTIPTLYNLSSSQAFRVLWALEELADAGIKYKLKNFPRKFGEHPEMVAVFPLGKSPIMTLESVDGSPPPTVQLEPGVLSEARLILQFVSDSYSNGVWEPESTEDKLRDTFFQEFALATMLLKADFALLFDLIPQFLPFPFKQLVRLLFSPILNHFFKDHRQIFLLMEDSLSDRRPWFAGEKIGLADFNMSFGMDMAAQRGWFDPEKYPKVGRWHEAIKQRPAYKRALELGGAYDLVKFT